MHQYCKKVILSALFVFYLVFSSNGQTWVLQWSDEFDYTGLPDNTKWAYDTGGGGWGNNELQYYTNRSENARVENGNLIIEALKESYGGRNYTSARLITKNKGDWKYGKIEVCAKLPGGRGSWPAIWMLPTNWVYGGWPASGEIDIMEYVGYDPGIVHASVHTDAYNHVDGTQKTASHNVSDAESAFHVYSIQWFDDKIAFYIDDTKYFTFFNGGSWQKWPFDQKFHLLLNIAVGGNWGGVQGVDDNIFPIRMEIDYVRVYQDPTTGFNGTEKSRAQKLGIFPNPVKNELNLSLPEDIQKINEIKFYSSSGNLVKTFKINSTDKLIHVKNLDLIPGNYIVQILSGNQSFVQQFVKL